MTLTRKAALLAAALAMPVTFASAQTQPPAANAPAPDPHHPAGQDTGATAPAPSIAPSAAPANPQAQMGMMMGDMRQMMAMMQQMMGMMSGASAPGGGPNAMMGGGMPMMGMMSGQQGAGGPGMGPGPMVGAPDAPGVFRHTEGILAFYRAELRITDAQAAPWNAFAEAVRTHVKNLQQVMQRVGTQRAATAPEQLDQRMAMLSAQLDASKAVAATGKALYAVLNAEQRKLADGFMAGHLRGMRGMMP